MAHATTFWKRMTTALRGVLPGLAVPSADLERRSARNGAGGGAGSNGHAGATTTSAHSSWTAGWLRPSRMAQVHSQQKQVLDDVDGIRERLIDLDRRTERVVASSEWIAGALEQLQAAQRAQGDQIGSLSKPLDATHKQVMAISAATTELPAALDAHTRELRSLGASVKQVGAGGERVEASLQLCLDRIDALRASWSEVIRSIRQAEAARDEVLRQQLDRHGRRMLLASLSMTGAAAALVAASFAAARFVM